MSVDDGHSDCKCSQNMDFFEQILKGKNPLEEWFKNEVLKILPDDVRNFAKLFDVNYDDKLKKSTMNLASNDHAENKRVDNDMSINTKILNNYINIASAKNAIMDYTSTDDHMMDVKAGKTMTYNYTCNKYNSNLVSALMI
jgi:hypothetical protein